MTKPFLHRKEIDQPGLQKPSGAQLVSHREAPQPVKAKGDTPCSRVGSAEAGTGVPKVCGGALSRGSIRSWVIAMMPRVFAWILGDALPLKKTKPSDSSDCLMRELCSVQLPQFELPSSTARVTGTCTMGCGVETLEPKRLRIQGLW